MFKIFLKIAVGSSCLLMIACSAKNYTNNVKFPSEPLIVDNHDGTFTDITNRLQWTKNDRTPGPGSCYEGTEKNFWSMQWHVDCLNKRKYLGYNDWRMPTYQELENLLATPEIKNGSILNQQVHERLRNHAYWSTADLALFIYLRGIMIYNAIGPIYIYHRYENYHVWPVRSENKGKLLASSKVK